MSEHRPPFHPQNGSGIGHFRDTLKPSAPRTFLFLFALALVALISVVALLSIRRFIEAAEQRSRAYSLIVTVGMIEASLLRAEAEERGFVSTQSRACLENHERALRQVDESLRSLRHLVADDPRYATRAVAIEAIVHEKKALMEQVVSLRETEGFEAAARGVATGRSLELSSRFHEIIREMEWIGHQDRELFHERVSRFGRRAWALVVIGTPLSIILLGGAFLWLNQETRQRELALRSLQESEERFRSTFEQAAVGVAHVDPEGRFLRVNGKYCEIAGYSSEELRTKRFQDITHPEDLDTDLEFVRQLLAGERTTYSMEKRYIRKDGNPVWVNLTVSLVREPSGGPRYFIAMVEDITPRKKAAEALRAKSEDLGRSNAELEQFAYVASHDLQEPLRTVTSFVQLLGQRYQGALGAEADEFIHFIVEGVDRMKRLINDLLSYSRVRTRGQPHQAVDCEAVLGAALISLTTAIEESGAVVTSDPLPTVWGDDSQIQALLENLIGNALKFRSKETPRVHVSATRKGDLWDFSVRDNGIGIESQYFNRIFLIFQRLHTREEYPGTGIGLAICHKIVENHGGRIWLESKPGEGSVFHFLLPAPRSSATGAVQEPGLTTSPQEGLGQRS
ncbi:MAG: PAS domain S-box protein [Candidatus Omnitrophica bacterium]|nr:PAS domain S-box protein [Candidatus Omnitrophota bacterium]